MQPTPELFLMFNIPQRAATSDTRAILARAALGRVGWGTERGTCDVIISVLGIGRVQLDEWANIHPRMWRMCSLLRVVSGWMRS